MGGDLLGVMGRFIFVNRSQRMSKLIKKYTLSLCSLFCVNTSTELFLQNKTNAAAVQNPL